MELILFDDGKHNDGMADDGIYAATTKILAEADYFVTAKTEFGGQTITAESSFVIEPKTAKTAAKTKK